MTTMLNRLQQLNNAELCILCHSYHITPGHIAADNRRRLEHKLLMAILAERGRLRALNAVQAGYQWLDIAHRVSSDISNAEQPIRGILRNGRRNAATNTTPPNERRVFQFPYPSPINRRRSINEQPMGRPMGESSNKSRYKAARELGQNALPLRGPSRDARRAAGTESLLNCGWHQSQISISYRNVGAPEKIELLCKEQLQGPQSDSSSFVSCSNCSDLTMKQNTMAQHSSRYNLNISPVFNLKPPNEIKLQLSGSEWSSELELHTLNYSSNEEPLSENTNTHNLLVEIMCRTQLRDDSEEEVLTLVAQRRNRSMWRYVLHLLCYNRYGDLDVNKIRCALLYCSLGVCLCMAFKMVYHKL